jgi:hypothetical protein
MGKKSFEEATGWGEMKKSMDLAKKAQAGVQSGNSKVSLLSFTA